MEEELSETVWESNVCQTLLTTNSIGPIHCHTLGQPLSAILELLAGRYMIIPFHGLEGVDIEDTVSSQRNLGVQTNS